MKTQTNARHIDPKALPPSYLNALLAQIGRQPTTETDRAFAATHTAGFEIIDDDFDERF